MNCCKANKSGEPSLYGKLWRVFVRPPRSNYSIRDLGPSRFTVNGKFVSRQDIDLKNSRN